MSSTSSLQKNEKNSQNYGETWWSRKWFEIFANLDEDERIKNGEFYYNSNPFFHIRIEEGEITAKAYGTYASPNEVTVKLIFKKFDEVTQRKIEDIVASSSLILNQLPFKKLAPQIVGKLEAVGVQLFPSPWEDITAKCNCDDKHPLCRHVVALIHFICNHINHNPFFLFQIHNCNLFEEYTKDSLENIETLPKIPSLKDLYEKKEKVQKTHKTPKSKENLPSQKEVTTLPEIDYSLIPNLFNTIIERVPSYAPFYHKDFRKTLEKVYKNWTKILLKKKKNFRSYPLQAYEEIFLSDWDHPETLDDFRLIINSDYLFNFFSDNNPLVFFDLTGQAEIPLSVFLEQIPNKLLPKLCYKLQLIQKVYQYSLELLEKSAVIPEVLEIGDEETLVRWVPAIFNESVRTTYEALCQACPKDLLVYDSHKLHRNDGKNEFFMNDQTIKFNVRKLNPKNIVEITPQEQIKTLISRFVGEFIEETISLRIFDYKMTPVEKLFFLKSPIMFKESHVSQIIHQWASNFYLSEKKYKFCLQVEEAEEGFELLPKIQLEGETTPVNIKEALSKSEAETQYSLISDLSLLTDYLPESDIILQEDTPTSFTLEEFTPLFSKIVPTLKDIGVQVILPKSLHKILKPEIKLQLEAFPEIEYDRESFLSLDKLLNFDWKIAIGDKKISIQEFEKMLKKSNGLVKMTNDYVLLDEKEMGALLKRIEKLPKHLTKNNFMHAMLAEEIDDIGVSLDEKLRGFLDNFYEYEPVPIPENLEATLRPYQERGFHWLIQNIKTSFGSILADDMGLGKTIQVISAILHLKDSQFFKKENCAIVIAPTSLLTNWQKEFEKFAPKIKTHLYHGPKREFSKNCDVLITSYGTVRSDKEKFKKLTPPLLVIDEAQNIKNPQSAQTKIIKSIQAEHKIAMSGTPVENRLLEYWSIFDFTNRGYLGSLDQFKSHYATPIEKGRDKRSLERFKKITAPFIFRRLKSDKTIIKDLPDKIENNRYCSLASEQAALYQKVVDTTIAKIALAEGMERRGLVLQLITFLKQICNHPAHFLKKSQKISAHQSGKMLVLEEVLSEIEETGEKSLIFTQYVEMGNILVNLLGKNNKYQIPFLHGGVPRKTRDKMVEDFQNPSSDTKVFVISLKAGGTGLNLTEATHVIHYDLWWNPAVENQATDRAYRIGQKKNVMVHRFITTGTFEERIDELIRSKKELAELTVGSGEKWITEMSTSDIEKLVHLGTY